VSLFRCPRALAVVVLTLLLVACGDDGGAQWRDASFEVPEGWSVFEEEETRFSMANEPLGEEFDPDERPEGDIVGMFFTHEPGTIPDDWREFVEGRDDAEIESDTAIELDGVPATRIIYSHRSGEERTREMAVIIPAREIVVFAQPVPEQGDPSGPDMFMRHLETFNAVLDSIEWGALID
jgi:hypothetical protein